jgi:sugar fermentation stimulation protein A
MAIMPGTNRRMRTPRHAQNAHAQGIIAGLVMKTPLLLVPSGITESADMNKQRGESGSLCFLGRKRCRTAKSRMLSGIDRAVTSDPLLPFSPGCISAVLVRREKRFLAECELPTGRFYAHTNNTGSMRGLLNPGSPVFLSPAAGGTRKLPWTLEMIGLTSNSASGERIAWVGVNTLTPNRLLRTAFQAGLLPWAQGYDSLRPEVRRRESRIDALLSGPGMPPLWVECKNVTMVEGDAAAFPDAPSLRGHKHLREMASIAASGERAVFFYCVQRQDGNLFAPAATIDPEYARLFYEAAAAGVECRPHRARLSEAGISLGEELPVKPES